MSFSFNPNFGPRGVIEQFGKDTEVGEVYNPRVVRRMLSFLTPYRWQMVVALVLMFVVTGLTLAAPYLMKIAIDQHIANRDITGLNRTAVLLGVTFMGLFAATAWQQYLLSWVGQRVLSNVRETLFRHIQSLSMSFHDRTISGVTVSRVMNDVAVINDLLTQGLISIVGDLLILIGIIFVMVSMSPQLALFTFAILPVMYLATYLFSRQAKVAFRETRHRIAAVVGGLAEDIGGIRVIQAFAQEKTAQDRFARVNSANRDANINAIRLSFLFLPAIEFLGMVATAIVLWFGGLAATRGGEVSVGVLVAFLAYVTRFFTPIQELSRLYTTMQSAMAGGEQVIKLLDTQPGVSDQPGSEEMPPIQGEIVFDGVTFRYREDGNPVMNDVSFAIQPGQTVALVGPTGAGKSTIANLIARFYDVSEGRVLVDGKDVRAVTQQSLRSQMGLVPQDAHLFSGTIEENIRFGQPGASFEQVKAAARLANAHDFIQRLPNGYQTVVLEGAVNLSLGQRQLICIARAALINPRIIILDEATANIDTVSEILIQRALRTLLQGRTAVVIAHRLSTIREADKIMVVDDGRVVEQGTHDELLARAGLYSQLYERQFVSV